MKLETMAIHEGRKVDAATGAVTPPLHFSTTFERDADGSYPLGYVYSRAGNPTRAALEDCLAALEGGVEAAAFSSGMAAIASVFQAFSPDDHVIVAADIYHGTARLLRQVMSRWRLDFTMVDMSRQAGVEASIRPNTRLIFIETPSNPLLKISDIAALAELAKRHGAYTVCDNTWATPVLQRPLELGSDLVVHSTTKYFGGHGDVLGGTVITRQRGKLFDRVREVQQEGGAVPSPFDCWLLLRSVRTLPLRMRTHCANARRLAEFLAEHEQVERVYYPGLADDAGHDAARSQMSDFGGMLSFTVKGGKERAMRVAANTSLFTRATSLGSFESLIEHRASIEGPETTTPDNLLRVSVGLEHPDDLVADLSRALAG